MRRRTKVNVTLAITLWLIASHYVAHHGFNLGPILSHFGYHLHSDDLTRLDQSQREMIEQRFKSRKASLREYCSRNYVPNEINFESLKWSSIIYDDALPSPRHPHHAAKFLGCVPPESGSTIFQAWWWDVYNPQLTFTQESRQLNQQRMAQIKENHRNKLLQSPHSIKFMVIRHPLTRFVGSWDDIFCTHCQIGRQIIQQNPTLSQISQQTSDSEYMIALPSLVNFVVQDRSNLEIDAHFSSQMSQCQPCAVDYDYIIKLETIQEDIQYLMALLDRPDNTKELVSQETISKNRNPDLYRHYFRTITDAALDALAHVHADDMNAFNYTLDTQSKAIGGWY